MGSRTPQTKTATASRITSITNNAETCPECAETQSTANNRQTYGNQRTLNGEVHDWYRIILGFPDHLVGMLLDKLDISEDQTVLDPFCGTGTTLVECMKRNITCVGIEANPACSFASRVKTTWTIQPNRLLESLNEVRGHYATEIGRRSAYKKDPAYEYLDQAGMLKRGWISETPLRKSIAIKNCIENLRTSRPYRDALRLALLSELVHGASNLKFGPQLYCSEKKKDADVLAGFEDRVRQMATDLHAVRSGARSSEARVYDGDSRNLEAVLKRDANAPFHGVICSPPYPTEHDYTRHTRLELAFLGKVRDTPSLRAIKKTMIRSHTKGVYSTDVDSSLVNGNALITPLVRNIEHRARKKTYGFARLYGKVTLEYFGGMKRHLTSLRRVLTPGAKCAYVLGDQSSYLQVNIPTAEILGRIAEEVGFKVLAIERWRGRRPTAISRIVDENILLLERG